MELSVTDDTKLEFFVPTSLMIMDASNLFSKNPEEWLQICRTWFPGEDSIWAESSINKDAGLIKYKETEILYACSDNADKNYRIDFLMNGTISNLNTVTSASGILCILKVKDYDIFGHTTKCGILVENFTGEIEASSDGFGGDLVLLFNESEYEE